MKTTNVSTMVLDRVNAALAALDSDALVTNCEATFASMLLKSLFGDLIENGKLADSIPSTEKVWEEFSSSYYTGKEMEEAYNGAVAALNSGLSANFSTNIEDSSEVIPAIKEVTKFSVKGSTYRTLVNTVGNGIGESLSPDPLRCNEVVEKVSTFFKTTHVKLYKGAYESLVDLLVKETGCNHYDYDPKKVVILYGNVSDWFVKNHNALRAVKPAAGTINSKASSYVHTWKTKAQLDAEYKAMLEEEAKKRNEEEAGEEAEEKKTSKKSKKAADTNKGNTKGTRKGKGNSKKAKDIDQSKVDALPNNEKVAVVETWLHNVAAEIGYNPARQYVAAKYKVKGQGYTAIATKLVDKVNIAELVKDKDYMNN